MANNIKIINTDEFFKIRFSKNLPKIIFSCQTKKFQKLEKMKSNRKIIKNDISKNNLILRMPEKSDAKELQKKITLILNSLSQNNIKNVSDKLHTLMIDEAITNYTLTTLFNQGINNMIYIQLYVELFKNISDNNKKQLIKIINAKKKFIEKTFDSEKKEEENYDDFCSRIGDEKTYGNIYVFITELFKEKIISKNIFINYMTLLFKNIKNNIDKDNITMYIKSLQKIITELNDVKIYKKYKKNIEDVQEYFVENKKTREKFMILDIVEMFEK